MRLAARQFRLTPGSYLYAALTLAIGLGAATAIYSVLEGLTSPLPVPAGEEVVQVRLEDPENGRSQTDMEDVRTWRRVGRSLSGIGAFSTFSAAVRQDRGVARTVAGARITDGLFDLVGVKPALGRLPGGQSGQEQSVVISHRLWMSWLGGDRGAIGKTVLLDGIPSTIVAVMPDGFQFPFREDLWQVLDTESSRWAEVEVVARLAGGVGAEEAGLELSELLRKSRTEATGIPSTARAKVLGFTEGRGESGEATMLMALLGMVLSLVLVSCFNVCNLLLERATARTRSLSLHQALGAPPGQVFLLVLGEALIVGMLGAAMGVAVAYGAVIFVQTTLADHWGYFWTRIEMSPTALLFAGTLGILTAAISGTLPAWRARDANLSQTLALGGRSGHSRRRPWTSWVLINGQVAFSCGAVIASVLLGLGLADTRRVAEGFPADSLMWSSVSLEGGLYEEEEARARYRRSILASLQEQAGVRGAALTTGLPFLASEARKVTLEGQSPDDEVRRVPVWGVTPGFFDVLEMKLIEGRGFRSSEPPHEVALVSEDFVRTRYAGSSPLGQRIRIHTGSEARETVRIVGVVSNLVVYDDPRFRPADQVYLPIADRGERPLVLAMRMKSGQPDAAAAAVRAALSADPEVPLGPISSLSDRLAYVRQFWETLGTLAILGGLGAVVAVTIGLYGLLSFEVRRRLPEFAVRMALGAGTDRVLGAVSWRVALLVVPGVTLGLGAAYFGAPLLGVFLEDASSHDPRVFAGILAVYGITAIAAGCAPAWRAARCNPVDVLRRE